MHWRYLGQPMPLDRGRQGGRGLNGCAPPRGPSLCFRFPLPALELRSAIRSKPAPRSRLPTRSIRQRACLEGLPGPPSMVGPRHWRQPADSPHMARCSLPSPLGVATAKNVAVIVEPICRYTARGHRRLSRQASSRVRSRCMRSEKCPRAPSSAGRVTPRRQLQSDRLAAKPLYSDRFRRCSASV